MGKIQLLSKDISELIAAGEVIERPASIVKELAENSIDAGAGAITVEIKNGGISYIRITDDGCGMEKDDIPLACLRHATSKIKSAADLDDIGTLGFRGEALASVTAVARVSISSKTDEMQYGAQLNIEGGEFGEVEDAGCPNGTTIVISDLFYNVPARLKFLKKYTSEANAVGGIVEKLALSHPEISFKFISDGKIKLQTSGNSSLKSTIYTVLGKDFADNILDVDYTSTTIKVTGFVSKPSGGRSNRGMQYFFVNGRYVKSKTCMVALEEGYKNSIMAGKYPTCVLRIDIPHEEVDVNVHPAKIEVRFVNERNIFDAVYFAVKTALLNDDIFRETVKSAATKNANLQFGNEIEQVKMPQNSVFTADKANDFAKERESVKLNDLTSENIQKNSSEYRPPIYGEKTTSSTVLRSSSVGYKKSENLAIDSVEEKSAEKSIEKTKQGYNGFDYIKQQHINSNEKAITLHLESGGVEKFVDGKAAEIRPAIHIKDEGSTDAGNGIFEIDEFEVIGELFSTYLIFQSGDTMLLLDKHAAHERILFEQLKKDVSSEDRQVLLTPIVVNISTEEFEAFSENPEKIAKLGFLAEEFGEHSVIIREAPMVLNESLCQEAFLEICAKLSQNNRDFSSDVFENLLHSIACRCAVKANDRTDISELKALLKQVHENDEIRYCPHGRPIVTAITKREIEKKFGRV